MFPGLVAVLEAGLAEAWGLGSWGAAEMGEALAEADRLGLPAPGALQVPYSVVWRGSLKSPEMARLLEERPIPVVASAPMAYGLLTGKYRGPEADGRMAGVWREKASAPVRQMVRAYLDLAERRDFDPAHLALASCLLHPSVKAVVFGAHSVGQLQHNLGAVDILDRVDEELLEELAGLSRIA